MEQGAKSKGQLRIANCGFLSYFTFSWACRRIRKVVRHIAYFRNFLAPHKD